MPSNISRPLSLSPAHLCMLGLGWVLLVIRKSENHPPWLSMPLIYGVVPIECAIWSTLVLHLMLIDL